MGAVDFLDSKRVTIYISAVKDQRQIRERMYVYVTMPDAITLTKNMLQRLDGGVAFVRNDNTKEWKQVGGTDKDNRKEIVERIEQKYSRKEDFKSFTGGSNIPAGYNDNGERL